MSPLCYVFVTKEYDKDFQYSRDMREILKQNTFLHVPVHGILIAYMM